MNRIKYWKVIKSNLSLADAMNILETRVIENKKYDRISICLHGREIDQYDNFKNLKFDYREVTSNEWMVCVPDNDKEELLLKVRELVKDEHFLKLTNDKIDNMNISDIWNAIDDYIVLYADDNAKYRIIKEFIKQKLYKKLF